MFKCTTIIYLYREIQGHVHNGCEVHSRKHNTPTVYVMYRRNYPNKYIVLYLE